MYQQFVDETGETSPPFSLLLERARAGLGDAVVLRLAVALGALPCALDPPLLFEANERGIQRALIEHQRMLRHLLEPRRQPVGMLRPHRRQRAQDDEIEGALQQLNAFSHDTLHLPFKWRVS